MKKLALLFMTALAVNANAQQWNIPTERKTLILKFTADWCGPCGSWGWTQTTDLISQETKALTLAFHESSSTTTSLNVPSSFGSAMEANLDKAVTGIPSFIVNNINKEQANTAACKAEVNTQTSGAAVANTGFLVTWKADSLIVSTRTKFFATASGDYYVAVYAYENGITAYQNGQGASAAHKHIMRIPTGATQWGTKLNGTSFTATSQQDITFRYTVPSAWNKANLNVFAVIWKKNGSKYEVVNVNEAKSFATSIENVTAANVDASVYPNPATNSFTVNVSNNITNATISLVDITGKRVAEVFNGSVTNGTINVARPSVADGMYFLHVNTDKGAQTLKITLQ